MNKIIILVVAIIGLLLCTSCSETSKKMGSINPSNNGGTEVKYSDTIWCVTGIKSNPETGYEIIDLSGKIGNQIINRTLKAKIEVEERPHNWNEILYYLCQPGYSYMRNENDSTAEIWTISDRGTEMLANEKNPIIYRIKKIRDK